MTARLCAWVKRPDKKPVLCTVEDYPILSRCSLLPLVHVRAVKGRPFQGLNELVVPQVNITFVMVQS